MLGIHMLSEYLTAVYASVSVVVDWLKYLSSLILFMTMFFQA